MPYHLLNHPKQYSISCKDMGVSVLTGFSGAPFAKRHWQLSNQFNYFGHRVIACLEYLPVLGALVAL